MILGIPSISNDLFFNYQTGFNVFRPVYTYWFWLHIFLQKFWKKIKTNFFLQTFIEKHILFLKNNQIIRFFFRPSIFTFSSKNFECLFKITITEGMCVAQPHRVNHIITPLCQFSKCGVLYERPCEHLIYHTKYTRDL